MSLANNPNRMKDLISGKTRIYEDREVVCPNQVRAANIGNHLLLPIRDAQGSNIRIDSETYGIKGTQWLCCNPRTGNLFVHEEIHVLYTDYDSERQSYTVESQYDAIHSITKEEAEAYFEVSLRAISA